MMRAFSLDTVLCGAYICFVVAELWESKMQKQIDEALKQISIAWLENNQERVRELQIKLSRLYSELRAEVRQVRS